MADEDFFDDVFGDPADDPLLQGEAPHTEGAGSTSAESDQSKDVSPPSWAHEASEPSGSSPSPSSNRSSPADSQEEGQEQGGAPSEKTVAVEVGTSDGLDEVNRSLKEGWRLVYVGLDERPRPGETSRSSQPNAASRTVLMTLRREQASTLFDFG